MVVTAFHEITQRFPVTVAYNVVLPYGLSFLLSGNK